MTYHSCNLFSRIQERFICRIKDWYVLIILFPFKQSITDVWIRMEIMSHLYHRLMFLVWKEQEIEEMAGTSDWSRKSCVPEVLIILLVYQVKSHFCLFIQIHFLKLSLFCLNKIPKLLHIFTKKNLLCFCPSTFYN
jgi:hypothetical protein